MRPYDKLLIANKMLTYFKENNISSFPNTSDIIRQLSESIHEQPWNCWKGWNLLRDLGKAKLRNPNGKEGGSILDYTLLSVTHNDELIVKETRKDILVQILAMLKRKYKTEWNECLGRLK
jgi:hypothetical protein